MQFTEPYLEGAWNLGKWRPSFELTASLIGFGVVLVRSQTPAWWGVFLHLGPLTIALQYGR